jgi:hypothetical protein
MRVGTHGKSGSVGNESSITYRPVKPLFPSNPTLTATPNGLLPVNALGFADRFQTNSRRDADFPFLIGGLVRVADDPLEAWRGHFERAGTSPSAHQALCLTKPAEPTERAVAQPLGQSLLVERENRVNPGGS